MGSNGLKLTQHDPTNISLHSLKSLTKITGPRWWRGLCSCTIAVVAPLMGQGQPTSTFSRTSGVRRPRRNCRLPGRLHGGCHGEMAIIWEYWCYNGICNQESYTLEFSVWVCLDMGQKPSFSREPADQPWNFWGTLFSNKLLWYKL